VGGGTIVVFGVCSFLRDCLESRLIVVFGVFHGSKYTVVLVVCICFYLYVQECIIWGFFVKGGGNRSFPTLG
jgi:hypothetical protein